MNVDMQAWNATRMRLVTFCKVALELVKARRLRRSKGSIPSTRSSYRGLYLPFLELDPTQRCRGAASSIPYAPGKVHQWFRGAHRRRALPSVQCPRYALRLVSLARCCHCWAVHKWLDRDLFHPLRSPWLAAQKKLKNTNKTLAIASIEFLTESPGSKL